VGADEANEDDAGIVVDFDDQAVAVSFDIKDHPVAGQDVSRGVAVFDFLRPLPAGGQSFMEPGFEGGPAVGVLFIKVA
jgi:hypothetical protein